MPSEIQDQQTEIVEEQSQDQADASESGVHESAETTTETESNEAEELLDKDVYERVKDNPELLRKELNKAFTTKSQALSAERKAIEPYAEFVRALEEDPRSAVMALAQSLGMKIPEEGATEKQAKTIGDAIMERVRERLGEEYGDLADKLAPAMAEVAQMVALAVAKPIKEELDSVVDSSTAAQARAAVEAFEKAHPDWKKHEKAMVALSKKLPPGEGMTEAEYLDVLYTIATRDTAIGDSVKKVVSRIGKSTGSGDNKGGVHSGQVATRSSSLPSFKEAYEAAKRGERIE